MSGSEGMCRIMRECSRWKIPLPSRCASEWKVLVLKVVTAIQCARGGNCVIPIESELCLCMALFSLICIITSTSTERRALTEILNVY